MRFLILIIACFISAQAFSCTREKAEEIVKTFIAQELSRVETVRTLKMGTVTIDDYLVPNPQTVVHAVIEVEKHGRKINEQVIVFQFNEFCNVTSNSGAMLRKVPFQAL